MILCLFMHGKLGSCHLSDRALAFLQVLFSLYKRAALSCLARHGARAAAVILSATEKSRFALRTQFTGLCTATKTTRLIYRRVVFVALITVPLHLPRKININAAPSIAFRNKSMQRVTLAFGIFAVDCNAEEVIYRFLQIYACKPVA